MLKLTTVFNNCKRIITRLSSKQIMSDVQVSEKGTFVQSLNPMTGQREWKMVADDYDYQQEVARAAFADMLHDTERVNTYYTSKFKSGKLNIFGAKGYNCIQYVLSVNFL